MFVSRTEPLITGISSASIGTLLFVFLAIGLRTGGVMDFSCLGDRGGRFALSFFLSRRRSFARTPFFFTRTLGFFERCGAFTSRFFFTLCFALRMPARTRFFGVLLLGFLLLIFARGTRRWGFFSFLLGFDFFTSGLCLIRCLAFRTARFGKAGDRLLGAMAAFASLLVSKSTKQTMATGARNERNARGRSLAMASAAWERRSTR